MSMFVAVIVTSLVGNVSAKDKSSAATLLSAMSRTVSDSIQDDLVLGKLGREWRWYRKGSVGSGPARIWVNRPNESMA